MNTKRNEVKAVPESRAKSPMLLHWFARKAGIPKARAEELWHEALCYATDKTGWIGTSEYWDVAETRLHKLIEREKHNCLPTPEISPWVRLQSRIAHLPLLAAESWSLVWVRMLSVRMP